MVLVLIFEQGVSIPLLKVIVRRVVGIMQLGVSALVIRDVTSCVEYVVTFVHLNAR